MRASLTKATAAEAVAARQVEDALRRLQTAPVTKVTQVSIACSGTTTDAAVPFPSASPSRSYLLFAATPAGLAVQATAVMIGLSPGVELLVHVRSLSAMSGEYLFNVLEV